MKIYSAKRGTSMSNAELNPYGVGLMRLKEMAIAVENFSDDDISYIGYCSIHRIEVVLCKVGNSWGVRGRMGEQIQHHEQQFSCRGHVRAYWIIRGKKVMALRKHSNKTAETLMAEYECMERLKPFAQMTALEIFNACQTQACPKHQGRGNRHSDIGKYK